MIGAGFGELEAEDAIAVSLGNDGVLSAVCGNAVRDVLFRVCAEGGIFVALATELMGDGGTGVPMAGDEDSEPALKGWKDTEGRRPVPSVDRSEDFRSGPALCVVCCLLESSDSSGELEGISCAARSADMGLEHVAGPT